MNSVDLYCERIEPGLLGEPLNAATNLALFIAAFFAWRYATRSDALTNGVKLLLVLLIAFGAGSTLFHTFANVITRWLDVLPIAAFITAYLWLYVRCLLNQSAAAATLVSVGFVVAAKPRASSPRF